MRLTNFWKMFQDQYPSTAVYFTMCFVAVMGLFIIFVFTHGQSRFGVDEDMKRIACIHAYGVYNAEKDVCIVRN